MIFLVVTTGILWLVLTGSFAMLAYGMIAIAAIYFLVTKAKIRPKLSRFNGLQLLYYFLWLSKEIIISAWSVTKICWSGQQNTIPSFAWVETKSTIQVLYAQSITVTPGTVTILVEEDKLLVHALDRSGIAELQSKQMEQQLNKILN